MSRLIEFFIRRPLFGNLLSVIVIIGGIFSLFQIRREMFPNVSYDVIQVQLLFPGASAEEVEKLLVTPLELDLKEVDGIKKIKSFTIEGSGSIYLTLDPDQTTEKEAEDEIQTVVDRFVLPANAEEPVVTALKTKQVPIVEAAVAGDLSELELRGFAKTAEKEMEKVNGVARVVETSVRKREVRVEVHPEKLQAFRLSLNDIIRALKDQNVSIPGGTLKPRAGEAQVEKLIRTLGDFETLEEIGNTVVRSNDLARPILVKDIATLKYSLDTASVLTRVNGQPSINLWVIKKEKYDAITMVDDLKLRVAALNDSFQSRQTQVNLSIFNDNSIYIRNRLQVITGNFIMGMSLVLLLLSLLLPWKLALIVALGEPFALLGSIMLFPQFDISINVISMIGIILVSGMLVDDSVLVCDNIYRKIEEGMDSVDAAVKGTLEVAPAVIASVAVILACFVPLMNMSGIFGKFVRQIPLGAMIPLVVSLFEGLFILPAHTGHWVKKPILNVDKAGRPTQKARWGKIWETKLLPKYEKALRILINHRYKTLAVLTASIVAVGFLAVKVMDLVLFPKEGVNIFYVRSEAPLGSSLEETTRLMKPVEVAIKALPQTEVLSFSTLIGAQMQEPMDPARKFGGQYAQVTVFLSPENQRTRTADQIQEALRKEIGNLEGLDDVRFESVNTGPPVGKAIDIGVRGETFEEIMKSVESIKKKIETYPGVLDVQDSYQKGKEEIKVKLIASEAAAAFLSPQEVGMAVRAAFEGVVATSIQELDDEVDIRVMYRENARKDLDNLYNLEIPNGRGNLVKLSRIATFEKDQGIATYIHEGRMRQVKVSSDLDVQITNNRKMAPIIDKIIAEEKLGFPNLEYVIGGESEDTNESFATLGTAFLYSIAFIFLVLVLLFKNLVQPMLILMVIPLGLVSSVLALFIHGQPLSFMAIMSMVALSGVIANNAIVFVDFVNQLRGSGKNLADSIIKTASLRIRPIMLTSITNVVGVMPIAYGLGGDDPFVAILALGLGWGLLVGSVLIAFFIPVGIAVTDDIRTFWERKLKHT